MTCSTPTRPSADRSTTATCSAPSRTPSATSVMAQAMGVDDVNASTDERWARLARLWSDAPEDAEHRRAVRDLMAAQSQEFHEHDVEYGYRHRSAAVIDDGSPEPSERDFRMFFPSTRPGCPLPHAWLEDDEFRRFSTLDLVSVDRFVLLAGERGRPGGTPLTSWPPSSGSRSTPGASGTPRATCATPACASSGSASSGPRARSSCDPTVASPSAPWEESRPGRHVACRPHSGAGANAMSGGESRRDWIGRETYLLVELLSQRLAGELEAVCRAQGLTAAQYPVMWVACLHEDEQGIPLGSISDGLVTNASDVSRLVTRLEAAGLLERTRSQADRRVVRVRPTSAAGSCSSMPPTRSRLSTGDSSPTSVTRSSSSSMRCSTEPSGPTSISTPPRPHHDGRLDRPAPSSLPPPLLEDLDDTAVTEVAGRALPEWSPGISLGVMDRVGIERAVLSVSATGVHFGDDGRARRLARACDDYGAGVVADIPGRLRVLRQPATTRRGRLTRRARPRLRRPRRRWPGPPELEQRRVLPRGSTLRPGPGRAGPAPCAGLRAPGHPRLLGNALRLFDPDR